MSIILCTDSFLIRDNHLGRATVSSVAVAHEVASMGYGLSLVSTAGTATGSGFVGTGSRLPGMASTASCASSVTGPLRGPAPTT